MLIIIVYNYDYDHLCIFCQSCFLNLTFESSSSGDIIEFCHPRRRNLNMNASFPPPGPDWHQLETGCTNCQLCIGRSGERSMGSRVRWVRRGGLEVGAQGKGPLDFQFIYIIKITFIAVFSVPECVASRIEVFWCGR